MLKTSTLRIATLKQDQVYRSMEDVPPKLRQRIRETLEGPNTETFFIANKEAYERVVEMVEGLPAEIQRLSRPVPFRYATRFWRTASRWRVAALVGVSLFGLGSLAWLVMSQIGKP